MRTAAPQLMAVVAVASLLVAVSPSADAGPAGAPGPTARPPSGPGPAAAAKLPPIIWSAERTAEQKNGSPFAGAISYSVEVRASTGAPLSANLRVRRAAHVLNVVPSSGPALATVPVSAPAGGSTKVGVSDPLGLHAGGCVPSFYVLDLGLPDTNEAKVMTVKPNCAYTNTANDPTAALPPDTKLAQRQGKLHHTAPILESEYACTATPGALVKPLRVKTIVKNGSTRPAQGVRLKLDGPEDFASAAFDLAPGASKEVVVGGGGGSKGIPGTYTLRIEDPAASLQGAVYQMGWNVVLSRACSPAVDPLTASNID